ncbi:HD domain-containing protein [Aminipila butyrica]|uniref:HD domain-containing protein n=1 Tax=Aminipila butyrica TaxID=433296 RepID=A0A858BUN4_9FIRM|nr:HD domain-containing protein [Aminipila butyrica]QIB69761.1 HD domain-containing protein [Aminipila butyrica]
MSKYDLINPEINDSRKADFKANKSPHACSYRLSVRPNFSEGYDYIRTDFIKDVDKILNHPYYSRYTDKTQVFSFYRNDDITRRALHVQLVSRIARTIGAALNLNLDLIEAIALGHDIGHTPFGHAGEDYLNDLYKTNTNRYFAHNLHSVRVLNTLIPYNLTLATLSGILCHNGEKGQQYYRPSDVTNFNQYNEIIEKSYIEGPKFMSTLVANSLEGCLVRICDMIAYVGKDRQDAYKASLTTTKEADYANTVLGSTNPEIIHNLTYNIINNSYGQDYISLDSEYFDALVVLKNENYKNIYEREEVREKYDSCIKPMMEDLYYALLDDLVSNNRNSMIFKHHIDFVMNFKRTKNYPDTEPNQIVVDYIASMTDDYFIALHEKMFPKSEHKIEFYSYFYKENQ